MPVDSFKDETVDLLCSGIQEPDREKITAMIECPPQELGDFAFPCFTLAKSMKKNPVQIAAELAEKIKPAGCVEKIEAKGPYLNFFLNKEQMAESAIKEILSEKDSYGSSNNNPETIMVEYFHANTHKAIHVGHIRNICLAESLCRIFEFTGNKVIRVNYQGDIGPHVAKCLWGLINLKDEIGEIPSVNRLRFLGNVYMKANALIEADEKLQAQSKKLLRDLYAGDKQLNKLWKDSRKWCLDEFEGLYKEFSVRYNEFYFESDMEFPARELSENLVKDGIAKESDGAIIIDLKNDNMGIFVLRTREGTALYSSKDIALARKKMSRYKIDKSIHVVGKEQELHFKQLFRSLSLMGPKERDFAGKSHHLIYGLVMLPTGKMSSRQGSVVFYDELKEQLISHSSSEVRKRHPEWKDSEVADTAKKIAFAALKLGMVSRDNEKELVFDWKQALSLEGETGPYVQYAYARICSIQKKHGKKLPSKTGFGLLREKEEAGLIRKLAQFPGAVESASGHSKPLIIARYLIDLSQAFNNYYHAHQILSADKKTRNARLLLIAAVRQVIKNGLGLLAIDATESM